MISPSRLDSILNGLREAAVGVLGDFCLDVYWDLDLGASEPSLETGKPTRPVRGQRYSPGGAGNVAANLKALGVNGVSVFGVVGEDPFGVRLRQELERMGADCTGLLVEPGEGWQTLTYIKPMLGEEEQSRIDMGNFNRLSDAVAESVVRALEQALDRLDVIIVNQQVRTGIHTPFFRRRLRALMKRAGNRVFLYDGRHFAGAYPEAWLKVNAHEALRLCGEERPVAELVMREEARRAARELFERTGRPVFVTRGDRGCVVRTPQGEHLIPGLEIIGPVDTVGAGDSFLAGLAAALAAGAEPAAAAEIGNFVAGVTVQQLHCTGTASPEQVRAIGTAPRYIYEPELAEDPRRARYAPGTEIEIVTAAPVQARFRFAVFDHDGTISTLRQGWEEVMEDMMIRSILGVHFADAAERLYHKVRNRVRTYIDQTTGVQTLVQMAGLVDMVREFGLAPEAEVLDAAGYKRIYNDALMERVRDRLARLERGELDVSDFTIKGAVSWLQRLHAAGIQLFLASGTDVADVTAEAQALGYAGLFEGRIYGAVGDVTREAKREVLDRILSDIGDSAHAALVTFGDGPVEVRETRRRGGLAVGVASDEVRRFGLNPAKRARLIRAGADAVVPDFSQGDSLAAWLGL